MSFILPARIIGDDAKVEFGWAGDAMTTARQPLVMVVEDDTEMNALECELLAAHGMRSVSAYTGTEALAVADESRADAVLLDVMLPELDGFETCRRLRLKCGGGLPIVMVTALDTDDCRQRGYDAGADAYLIKPFDPDEIVSVLQVLMGPDRQRSDQ